MKNENKADASPSRECEAQGQPEKRFLSDRDRDIFLALLDSDEEHNEALKKAANEALRLDAEEEALVVEGLMRLPTKNRSDDFLALPAPQVAMDDMQAVIGAERNED